MSPAQSRHQNDFLIDKAEALAYSDRWPRKDRGTLRQLVKEYIEARRVDDGRRASELEAIIRRCVYAGESAKHALATAGVKLAR